MAFELSTLDLPAFAAKGARMVIRHPGTGRPLVDKDGKEAALLLAGRDSEQYRAAERQATVEAVAEAERRKEAGNPPMTMADLDAREQRTRRVLVAATLGWENVSINGEVAFTPPLATELFRGQAWLVEQAIAFIEDRRNYLPGPTGAPRSTTQEA